MSDALITWYVVAGQAPEVPGGLFALPIAIFALATFGIAYEAGREKGRMEVEAEARAQDRKRKTAAREDDKEDHEGAGAPYPS